MLFIGTSQGIYTHSEKQRPPVLEKGVDVKLRVVVEHARGATSQIGVYPAFALVKHILYAAIVTARTRLILPQHPHDDIGSHLGCYLLQFLLLHIGALLKKPLLHIVPVGFPSAQSLALGTYTVFGRRVEEYLQVVPARESLRQDVPLLFGRHGARDGDTIGAHREPHVLCFIGACQEGGALRLAVGHLIGQYLRVAEVPVPVEVEHTLL